jgi:hypothetical protein
MPYHTHFDTSIDRADLPRGSTNQCGASVRSCTPDRKADSSPTKMWPCFCGRVCSLYKVCVCSVQVCMYVYFLMLCVEGYMYMYVVRHGK